jgi:vitamin B12 transporter
MRRGLIFLAALIFFSFPALPLPEDGQKQKPPASVPAEHHEIVVTATRLETPARELASSVTVIPSWTLKRSKEIFALEAVRAACGVSILQNGGPGGAASVFLRGANSEHTLVLIDGVEINDPVNPSRSADLAHLTLLDVERLEIIRGPQSPVYGSDALGGIVNVITARGMDRPRWTLGSSAGSFGTIAGQAGVSGSTGRFDYSFGLSRYQTDGISSAGRRYPGNSEKDGYDNLTLAGRFGLKLRDDLDVTVAARSTRATTEIDNYGGPGGDDPNNIQDYASLFFRGEIHGLFLQNRWEQKLSCAVVRSRRDHDNPADGIHPFESEKGFFMSRLFKLDWQNNLFLHPANTLTLGLEFESELAESEYISEGLWGPFESLFPQKRAETTGIYVQDVIRLADRFFAAAGLRFDNHSRAGNALTYRVAPAYIFPATQTKLRASLSTGFKSPSLYQLYAPPTSFGPIGNMNLRAERSFGWEAGIEQPLLGDIIRGSAAYFENHFRDLIDFDTTRGYINIGRAESRGLEVELEARPGRDLWFFGSLTHLRTRDTIAKTSLLRRPKDVFSAGLSYSFLKRWAGSLSLNCVGEREDMDYSLFPARRISLPAYALLNGVLSWDVRPRIQAFIRLDNILDADYEMVYGYGTPGFSIRAGVNLTSGSGLNN